MNEGSHNTDANRVKRLTAMFDAPDELQISPAQTRQNRSQTTFISPRPLPKISNHETISTQRTSQYPKPPPKNLKPPNDTTNSQNQFNSTNTAVPQTENAINSSVSNNNETRDTNINDTKIRSATISANNRRSIETKSKAVAIDDITESMLLDSSSSANTETSSNVCV